MALEGELQKVMTESLVATLTSEGSTATGALLGADVEGDNDWGAPHLGASQSTPGSLDVPFWAPALIHPPVLCGTC